MNQADTPVVFNYAEWIAMFPQFNPSVTSPQAQGYFNTASIYVANGDACCSGSAVLVPNCGPSFMRKQVLYLMTAHVAMLFAGINGQPASALVGRINAATQGSVNVSAEMNYPPGSASWFNQTPFGAAVYQMLAPFRTMTYVPGPQFQPPYSFVPQPFTVPGWGNG